MVLFLVWRNPLASRAMRVGTAIAVVLLTLGATAALTKLYNEKVIKAREAKVTKKAEEQPKGGFLFGYRVLDEGKGTRLLVGKNIPRVDMEITLKQAARDLAPARAPFKALAFDSEKNNGTPGDPSFVGMVIADATGKVQVRWGAGNAATGVKPTL